MTAEMNEEDRILVRNAKSIAQRLVGLADFVSQGHGDAPLCEAGVPWTTPRKALREIVESVNSLPSTRELHQMNADYAVLFFRKEIRLEQLLRSARTEYRKQGKAGVADSEVLSSLRSKMESRLSYYPISDERWADIRNWLDACMRGTCSPTQAVRKIGLLVLGPIYGIGEDAFREGAAERMRRRYLAVPPNGWANNIGFTAGHVLFEDLLEGVFEGIAIPPKPKRQAPTKPKKNVTARKKK